MRHVCAVVLVIAGLSCSDELANPLITADELVVVVNSTDNSLTVIPVNDPQRAEIIPLGTATGTPVSLAVRGPVAAVPLGLDHAVALADLRTGQVQRTVALAQGSGATGAVFESDSVLWVANPGLNTVTRIRAATGDTVSVGVGRYPQSLAVVDGKLWVLNANLVAFAPAGPGWLTVIDLATRVVEDSVSLSGDNSQFLVHAADGLLYVVHSGRFGAGTGRLSIVDPGRRAELVVVNGLGEFPGSAADDPHHSRILIASFAHGLMQLDRLSRSLTAGPGQGLRIDGAGFSAVTLDGAGRIYALQSGNCVEPGRVQILRADLSRVRTVPAGACPFAVATTRLER